MPGRLNESNTVASSPTSGQQLTNQNLKKAKGNNEANKYESRKSDARKQDCLPSMETNSGIKTGKGK